MKKILKRLVVTFMVFVMAAETITYLGGGFKSKAANTIGEQEKLYYGYNVTKGISLSEPDALQTAHPIIDPNSVAPISA